MSKRIQNRLQDSNTFLRIILPILHVSLFKNQCQVFFYVFYAYYTCHFDVVFTAV